MNLIMSLRGHGHVELVLRHRSESRLLRFAPWTKRAWVTINGVIYPPAMLSLELIASRINHFESTLAHEAVHVEQQRRMGWLLFALAYVLLPIPFMAPLRAWLEAEAYAHECLWYGASYSDAVNAICSRLYLYPVPRFVARWLLMRKAVIP